MVAHECYHSFHDTEGPGEEPLGRCFPTAKVEGHFPTRFLRRGPSRRCAARVDGDTLTEQLVPENQGSVSSNRSVRLFITFKGADH